METTISNAEFEVMDVLWAKSPMPASDVATRITGKKQWSNNTVKTLLARLAAKGVVAHQTEGRRYLYRPLISRAAYAARETKALADKLCGGRAAPLVAHLASARQLTAEDINDLETIIAEWKRALA